MIKSAYTLGYEDAIVKLAAFPNKNNRQLMNAIKRLGNETTKDGYLTDRANRLLFGPAKDALPEVKKLYNVNK